MILTNCLFLIHSVNLSIFSPCLFDSSTSYRLKHKSWKQTVEKTRKTFIFNMLLCTYSQFVHFICGKNERIEILLKNLYHLMLLVIKLLHKTSSKVILKQCSYLYWHCSKINKTNTNTYYISAPWINLNDQEISFSWFLSLKVRL